jgi:phosphate starvation-inducible PhoH-like protein
MNRATSASAVIELGDPRTAEVLYGRRHENIRQAQQSLGVRIHDRGQRLEIVGRDERQVAFARDLIYQLYELVESGFVLTRNDVEHAARALRAAPNVRVADIFLDTVLVTDRGRSIYPKGAAQKRYVEAMRENDLVFGVGPAGTGKTYLAMAMGLSLLLNRQVKRIILTRPAVEAGEKLGFLPGDLFEKVNPYLRPLYDALHDMLDIEKASRFLERGAIEVAPLAFMRGRTLNDSFVILDEAQNSTREQMKMFLTRLGFDTKAVVTGDVTQVDLPSHQTSGLSHASELLRRIEGIAICRFSDLDVVRHPLVMKIIRAYDAEEGDQAQQQAGQDKP